MAETLKDKRPKAVVAEVAHAGEQLIVPVKMTLEQPIDLLARRLKYMDEPVAKVGLY